MMMFLLSSCSSIQYLLQAGKGQMRLMNRGRPLAEVISDKRTDPALADLLRKIPGIRAFGERNGLRPTPNYRDYVELGQDSVVYVVTVSEPLAFKPEVFRFPIVGSFSYLGWFSKDDALGFAAEYEKKGMDTDVRGASAYSTLGWFRDPLLSSMIPKEEGRISESAFPELVNVFLHESVHATVYVDDQSWFNESLASFVADILTDRYFKEAGLLGSGAFLAYQERRKHGERIGERLARAYADLKGIYDSDLPPGVKREKKEAVIGSLQKELGLKRRITNATLIQFKTYDPGDHGFGRLLEASGGDVGVFLGRIARLKRSDFPEPQMERFDGVLERLPR